MPEKNLAILIYGKVTALKRDQFGRSVGEWIMLTMIEM